MRIPCRALPALFVAALAVPAARGQDPDFTDLLRRVPDEANAAIFLDVKAVHQCPLGVQKKWSEAHEKNYLSGVSSLPPSISKIVLAAQINPSTLEDVWKIGVARLKEEMTLSQLLRTEIGNADKVGGVDVALTARNSYVVQFEPKIVGRMSPANRQGLARWLRFATQSKSPVVSAYLQNAASLVGEKTPVIMAVDLADIPEAEGVRHRLQESKVLGGKVDLEQATHIITSLKGLTLLVHLDRDMRGELRVDFGEPVQPLQPVAKNLLLESLGGMGMYVQDLEEWDAEASVKTITLRGKLSESGLRLLLSPMLSPNTTSQPQATITSQTNVTLEATQRYFNSIKTLTADLKRQDGTTSRKISYFYSKYADKINELPMANVDEDMLKHGGAVASLLRALANASKNASNANNIAVLQAQSGVVGTGGYYSGYGYGYGGGYGYNYNTPGGLALVNNYQQIATVMMGNASSVADLRNRVWTAINEGNLAIRKKMLDKYKVDF